MRRPLARCEQLLRFVERMRDHQVASGQKVRRLPLSDLFKFTGVQLIINQVARVDPDGRQVELSGAEPIRYDLLVYALGSHADRDAVPGAAEHAYAVADVEQAERLRARMHTAGTVAVIGAGPTGLETATALAETYRPYGAAGHQRSAGRRTVRARSRVPAPRLQPPRHQVWEHARVAEVDANALLEGGGHVDADTVAAGWRGCRRRAPSCDQ